MGRAAPEPRGAVCHGRPATHLAADLAAHDHRRGLVEALALGQVAPCHPVERCPGGERGLGTPPLPRAW